MKIYMIEAKVYGKDSVGIDYQVADGGCLPMVYTSKAKALAGAKRKIEIYQEKWGYDLVMQSPEYPAVGQDCLYAARLYDKEGRYRHEIRVYEQFTW